MSSRTAFATIETTAHMLFCIIKRLFLILFLEKAWEGVALQENCTLHFFGCCILSCEPF